MAIGERIKYFRNLRGMTMKELGFNLGFTEKTADVRVSQYESGKRIPKNELVEKLADELGVSVAALNVPDIDTSTGVINTLFAVEDLYGLYVDDIDGEICLRIDMQKGQDSQDSILLLQMLNSWYIQHLKYESGKISKEEYDNWRYNHFDKD